MELYCYCGTDNAGDGYFFIKNWKNFNILTCENIGKISFLNFKQYPGLGRFYF
jgi:hypothetical protein